MSLPDHVRQELRNKLWSLADNISWLSLATSEKSRYYESWTRDPEIGGLIARYIPIGDVRVYLKDTLLKDFARHKRADHSAIFRTLGISESMVLETHVKPHGRKLRDGRIMCWGPASTWKAIVMATYERAYGNSRSSPFAVVLTHAVGRYKQSTIRKMVERAARRLGVDRVEWLEQ